MGKSKAVKLVESIREALRGKEKKELEVTTQVNDLQKEIGELDGQLEALSYKALIEEDATKAKEYDKLKVTREKKVKEWELAKEKVRALEKFELGIDAKGKALEIYKETKKEIDDEAKKLGKLTTEFQDIKIELDKKYREIMTVYGGIKGMPSRISEVVHLLDPEEIGKTQKDIEMYGGHFDDSTSLFDNVSTNYKDSRISSKEMGDIISGRISLKR